PDWNKTQIAKVAFAVVGILISALLIGLRFIPAEGCGPSQEERQLLQTLNNLDEVISHGGYVKEVQMKLDGEDDDVYGYEAEIVNEQGVPIGRLRGGRVAGFGTMKPRFLWYKTPGVPEEWPQRNDRRGRRR
ncbi:MAG TPA: hypothetical protein PLO53_13235, partial [Candidatus Hydrogenedentes bacterium]|nr:hypothetical protein [Candidatus Hydrogenedentota bacterium]